MKVFVVTIGQYSDCRVAGVFSTSEQAADVAKQCGGNDVESFELDVFNLIPVGKYPFFVRMTQDGEIKEVSTPSFVHSDGDISEVIQFGHERIRDVAGKKTKRPYLQMNIWAADETHAVKIVNEKRTQIIALGKWGQEDLII